MPCESRDAAFRGWGGAVQAQKQGSVLVQFSPLWLVTTPVGVTWQIPGEEVHAAHLLYLCFLPFGLQNFRGKKVSGPSTKASNYTTPLMNLRAKASTRTPRARSAPDCGRASCPRMTTGLPTSTTSHGSGTGSPSQLWQVRSQWPPSEGAIDPTLHTHLR